ncbi:MAG: hypothetical protein ACYCZY_11000 [Lacisediminihabitans sp.]
MAPTTTQRPGLRAHTEAVSFTLPEIVSHLLDILGPRLVAYIGNVKSTRPVGEWAHGQRTPGEVDADRLRAAYQIAALLRETEGPATVQSWFKGMNPELDDASPGRVLREEVPEEAGPKVMAAARSFAFVG